MYGYMLSDRDVYVMKKTRNYLMILLLILSIVASFIAISHRYIGVYNPVSTLVGLFDVLILNEECIKIQNEPKVIIANKNFDIEKYMESVPYE